MTFKFPHRSLEFLQESASYVAYARIWWDGFGIDAAIWHEAEGSFWRTVLATGEVQSPTIPAVVASELITKTEFDAVVGGLIDSGLATIPSQSVRHAYLHYDSCYLIKSSLDTDPHMLSIKGGMHSDKREFEIMKYVITKAPELLPTDEE